MPSWDPEQYVKFGDHRARPFADLLARVPAGQPAMVVDLGCGPGGLTSTLADRWPGARVLGVDSSVEMIAAARARARPGLGFELADLRDWVAAATPGSQDVLVSNATLQWVPDHLQLLPALVELLTARGWLAVQIPGNHASPSHTLLRDLADRRPYAEFAADSAWRQPLPGPTDYLRRLSALGCEVDAWETTYLHVLHGVDPVLEWMSGTGARPVLQVLPQGLRETFTEEYRALLREAYPAGDVGTLLPFRRVFAVARRH